jgi:hypothetical protein
MSSTNVTAHPTAQRTRQQLRDAVGYEERYAYLLHDRDTIFSAELDESIQRLGLRVLKSPPRSPRRTPSVNASSGSFGENVWTGSSRFRKRIYGGR